MKRLITSKNKRKLTKQFQDMKLERHLSQSAVLSGSIVQINSELDAYQTVREFKLKGQKAHQQRVAKFLKKNKRQRKKYMKDRSYLSSSLGPITIPFIENRVIVDL